MTELQILELDQIEAIQQSIYDLCHQRDIWKFRGDPNALKGIEARIERLYEAQRELAELRDIKKALKVLKELAD
jgi:hypothetical protein